MTMHFMKLLQGSDVDFLVIFSKFINLRLK